MSDDVDGTASGPDDDGPPDAAQPAARDRWTDERTTFQRVYDVLTGTREPEPAAAYAERAACSETGARSALDQLVEMGIAERRDGRPATYRRNDAYFEWRRVERLAREHGPRDLRARLDDLADAAADFRDRFDAPDPAAVSTAEGPATDADALRDRWDALREWRTVRRDMRVLRRAIDRAEREPDPAVA